LLRSGLGKSGAFRLDELKNDPELPRFSADGLDKPVPEPSWDDFEVRPPGFIERVFGGRQRYELEIAEARRRFSQARAAVAEENERRQRRLADLRRQHERRIGEIKEEARRKNLAIDEMQRKVNQRDKDAVESFLSAALLNVPFPSDFPRNVQAAFNPTRAQLIAQVELPPASVVPVWKGFQYVRAKDEIKSLMRPKREIGEIYRGVVSQVALLYLRAVLRSAPWLESVALNGHVEAINPATGDEEYPCIISVEVGRGDFISDEKLRRVTAEDCLRHLRAIMSPHPYEQEPIEPILDFDLSKFSFIEGLDAVATLDSRPNLMEMSYTNFEHLVRQIFEAQGAEGWTTTQSNDDGIDAVIINRKALMGGLSIVQAKQYSPGRKLGPSHLRELAGAMEEKKAGWGILITTSTFTAGCEQKAREHGRMELIDGSRLIWLIKEHLHKDVLIGPPAKPKK
jgi:restriction system protein